MGERLNRRRRRTEYHEVSRKQLGRCARIIHALATEVDRRGYTVSNVTKTLDGYRGERWSGSKDGHLVITIRGHNYDLRVWEEKVSLRGDWERERKRRAEHRFDYFSSYTPLKPFDKDATGRLTITVDSGYSREGRPASWADRKSWSLEEKLGELLRELEIRAAEDDHRDALAQSAAEERQRQWELAAEWIRDYVDRLDPLHSAPAMPESPEPSPDDLKPFLGGLSPYGPRGW